MIKNYILIFLYITVNAALHAQPKADIYNIARTGTLEQAKAAFSSDPKLYNAVSPEGFTPLILAAYRGNNEVAKFLIDHGADVNFKSNMGTPLMAAVVKSNLEITQYLLEHKADPNLADQNGTTALIYAAMFRNYEIAKLLVSHKANTETKDGQGKSAVDYAIVADDDKLMEILKHKY